MRFVRRDLKALKSSLLRPVILCGENSLKIFCLGVCLSFAGQFVLVEISSRMAMQILVSVVGIAVMTAIAALITWNKLTAEETQKLGKSVKFAGVKLERTISIDAVVPNARTALSQ